MTYSEYKVNPLSVDINESDFPRLEAYSKVSVRAFICSIVPRWVQTDSVKAAIDDAIVMQIAFISGLDLNVLLGGKVVKSESLEGYSQSYEYTQVGGMFICLQSAQLLETELRANGLMYRGL